MGSNGQQRPADRPRSVGGQRRGMKKAPISGGFVERMMGLEPTTFSMARRRSSQLSYIRKRAQYSRGPGVLGGVQGLVDERVRELVVLPAHGRKADAAELAREPPGA